MLPMSEKSLEEIVWDWYEHELGNEHHTDRESCDLLAAAIRKAKCVIEHKYCSILEAGYKYCGCEQQHWQGQCINCGQPKPKEGE